MIIVGLLTAIIVVNQCLWFPLSCPHFIHRRTRAVFDVALKVHYKLQQRDLEYGRNLGNWILRWLDRMKPSAQIRGPPPEKPSNGASSSMSMTKQVSNSTQLKSPGTTQTSRNQESDRHLFTSYKNAWPKPFASISMMRVPKPIGTMTQYRHLCANGVGALGSSYTRSRFEGVIRKDIMQWMQQNWLGKNFLCRYSMACGIRDRWDQIISGFWDVPFDAMQWIHWSFLFRLLWRLKTISLDSQIFLFFSFSCGPICFFEIFLWGKFSDFGLAKGGTSG